MRTKTSISGREMQLNNMTDMNIVLSQAAHGRIRTEERPKEFMLRNVFSPLFVLPPQRCFPLEIEEWNGQGDPNHE
jgi:hypothetical protein